MAATQPRSPEAGIRNHRPMFIRESAFGDWGSDPDHLRYSDSINTVNWAPEAILEARRGLGYAHPQDHKKGPESHTLTVNYDLVKWFTTGGGNPNDAAYDGLVRDADNLLPNSHTFVDRQDLGSIAAENTVAGNTSYDTRLYTVGSGGLIGTVTVTGDPSNAQPVQVELVYVFQKVRSYQIDQPASATGLVVVSTDASDTNQTLTIENADASVQDTVSLDGVTDVATTNENFADIDALELDLECTGNVEVYINEGTTSSPTKGDKLAVIYGADNYDGVEGDLGIPAVGAGSQETVGSLGNVETFIGDVVNKAASPVPHEIPSAVFSVENNITTNNSSKRFGMSLHPGNASATMTANMYGEAHTHDILVDALSNNARNWSWEMDGGTLQLDNGAITSPGERASEQGQAVLTTENVIEGTGVTITEA